MMIDLQNIKNWCRDINSRIPNTTVEAVVNRAIAAESELETLRTKIAEIEKQKPVASRRKDFMGNYVYRNEAILGNEPLFAMPVPPSPAVAVPAITDEIKEALRQAIMVVALRAGDVSTEDGNYATTCTDSIIRLEEALCAALGTQYDDIDLDEAIPLLNAMLSTPTPPSAGRPTDPNEIFGHAGNRIRFDYINADGNWDSKIISHDEMRERYANLMSAKKLMQPDSLPCAKLDMDKCCCGSSGSSCQICPLHGKRADFDDARIAADKAEQPDSSPSAEQKLDKYIDLLESKSIAAAEEKFGVKFEQPDSAAPEIYAYCAEVMVDGVWVWSCERGSELPKVGKGTYSNIREVIPLYREIPSASKPQRITEQDAREIAESYFNYRTSMDDEEASFVSSFFTHWNISEGRTLLDKLNEHREPDYKAQTKKTWLDACEWIRNNYQSYPNIATLIDSMKEYFYVKK